MPVRIANIFTLALAWLAALVAPHFQSSPGLLDLLLDVAITITIFCSISFLLENQLTQIHVLKLGLLVLSFGGFLCGAVALRLGQTLIYDYWSHFGAGPMRLDGRIFLFGDLAHLTSAASCSTRIEVGVDVCDPWGRKYNQNVLIGEIFRSLHLTDTFAVGMAILVLFILAMLSATSYLKIKSLEIYLFLLSPVVVLAIDRGNELLTCSLILGGIYFLHRHTNLQQLIGATLLGLAVIFKLWPILLVVSFLLFNWLRIRIAAKCLLILIASYFIANIAGFREISSVTQPGSALGVSFGFKFFMSSQLSDSQLLFLLFIFLIMTGLLIIKFHSRLDFFVQSSTGKQALPWMLPIMVTYLGVWALTESYIYRMVILVPLILLLSKEEVSKYSWAKSIQRVILVSAISARLPITIAITSALAIYFFWVLILIALKALRTRLVLFETTNPFGVER